MGFVCSCGTIGFENTGTPSCQTIMSVTRKLIFVPYFDDSGAINSIAYSPSPALDKAWFDAKTTADKDKRWYPTPLIDNVVDERAESITEGLDSGKEIFIQEGQRTFSGVMINQTPEFLGKLKSMKCGAVGVFVVDKLGNIIGSENSDKTALNPIRIDENTFDPILVKTTDTTTSKIQVNFTYSDIEADEDLKMILSSEMSYDALLLRGLLDINSSATTGTTTSFTTVLTLDYGSALNPKKVEGLVLADFALYNNTTVSSVAISTVTESPAGTYQVDYPAQTASDVVVLSIDNSANVSYEMKANEVTLS